MKLQSVIQTECLLPGASFGSKDEVLRKIAAMATKCASLSHVDEASVYAGLKHREEVGSTAFGSSIAIPHCRLREVDDFTVGMISIPGGVDFGATDNGDVRLVAFIVGPERETNDHIALLSEISHAMLTPGAIEEMIRAQSAEEMRRALIQYSRGTVEEKDHTSRNLFHVFVTDEDKFREILQVFTAMEASALSVVEGKTAAEYLSRMPLFAGFWSDREAFVCRAITALVEKDFTNEVVRRIEQIAGDMNETRDVAVAVQNVFYSSGMLWS